MTTATRPCLTARQLQVIALVAQGMTNLEIAAALGLTLSVVKDRIAAALLHTGAGERAGLVAVACRAGQLQDVPRQAEGPVVLSPQSAGVLAGIAEGLPNKLIARRLNRPEGTVKTWVKALLRALGARDRAHAVLIAWQLRVLPEVS